MMREENSTSANCVSLEARPGLRLTISDKLCDSPEDLCENTPPILYYGFMAQGETSQMEVNRNISAIVEPLRPVLLALGEPAYCVGRETPGVRYVKLGLSMDLRSMEDMAETYGIEDFRLLHSRLRDTLGCWQLSGSSAAQAVIAEFGSMPRHEGLTNLWLEASALRLTAEICRLMLRDGEEERRSGLTLRAIRRTRKLRDIIEANLTAPLSLADLSRELGVNPTTMAAQFKKLYGLSIFAYLREARLQKARSGPQRGASRLRRGF